MVTALQVVMRMRVSLYSELSSFPRLPFCRSTHFLLLTKPPFFPLLPLSSNYSSLQTQTISSHSHSLPGSQSLSCFWVSRKSFHGLLTPSTGTDTENKPFSVLFVCLGNICRSPAAEGVFRDIVKKRALDSNFKIDSAGTIDYHEVLDLLEDACESLLDSILAENSRLNS